MAGNTEALHQKWRALAVGKGLLVHRQDSNEQRSSVPTQAAGISLKFIKGLAACVEEALSLEPSGRSLTTRQWVALMGPRTGASRSGSGENQHVRLWDYIPAAHTGAPSHYIVHAWDADFLGMLRSLVARLCHIPSADDHDDPEAEEERILTSTYVWLDVISLPQHPPIGSNSSTGYGPPPGSFDLAAVRTMMGACPCGALVVLDPGMTLLARSWVLYEAWAAQYYCTPETSAGRLAVALPQGTDMATIEALRAACTKGLDLGRSESACPDDKARILSEVKKASGLKRMQEAVGSGLLRATRVWLRWSRGLRESALYALILIKSCEYSLLLDFLQTVPNIYDDEKVLDEIRSIFHMFDTDGTGELDTEEFCSVLHLAGFSEEEAHRIFRTVDKDGGGSVSLCEFEGWWIASSQTDYAAVRHKVDHTYEGLLSSLQSFVELLERKNEMQLADNIQMVTNSLCQRLKEASVNLGNTLPPYQIKGHLRQTCDSVVFKIGAGSYMTACRSVYKLLQQNTDALALSGPPHETLPPPEALRTEHLQKVGLAYYLSLIGEMLSRAPGTLHESEHITREALDLVAGEVQVSSYDTSMSSSFDQASGAQKEHGTVLGSALAAAKKMFKSNRKQHQDTTRTDIVTSMIQLKYGGNTLVSNRLLKEASLSLSMWMASSKHEASMRAATVANMSSATKPLKKESAAAQKMSARQFAASYLSGGGNTSAAGQSGASGSNGGDPKDSAEVSPLAASRTLGHALQAKLTAHQHMTLMSKQMEQETGQTPQPPQDDGPTSGETSTAGPDSNIPLWEQHDAAHYGRPGSDTGVRSRPASVQGVVQPLRTSSGAVPVPPSNTGGTTAAGSARASSSNRKMRYRLGSSPGSTLVAAPGGGGGPGLSNEQRAVSRSGVRDDLESAAIRLVTPDPCAAPLPGSDGSLPSARTSVTGGRFELLRSRMGGRTTPDLLRASLPTASLSSGGGVSTPGSDSIPITLSSATPPPSCFTRPASLSLTPHSFPSTVTPSRSQSGGVSPLTPATPPSQQPSRLGLALGLTLSSHSPLAPARSHTSLGFSTGTDPPAGTTLARSGGSGTYFSSTSSPFASHSYTVTQTHGLYRSSIGDCSTGHTRYSGESAAITSPDPNAQLPTLQKGWDGPGGLRPSTGSGNFPSVLSAPSPHPNAQPPFLQPHSRRQLAGSWQPGDSVTSGALSGSLPASGISQPPSARTSPSRQGMRASDILQTRHKGGLAQAMRCQTPAGLNIPRDSLLRPQLSADAHALHAAVGMPERSSKSMLFPALMPLSSSLPQQ